MQKFCKADGHRKVKYYYFDMLNEDKELVGAYVCSCYEGEEYQTIILARKLVEKFELAHCNIRENKIQSLDDYYNSVVSLSAEYLIYLLDNYSLDRVEEIIEQELY